MVEIMSDRIKTTALGLGQTVIWALTRGIGGIPWALGTSLIILHSHRAEVRAKEYVSREQG